MATYSFAAVTVNRLQALLKSADPQGTQSVSILGMNRLAVGHDPRQPATIIDLSDERLFPHSSELGGSKGSGDEEHDALTPKRTARRSGVYSFVIRGKRTECRSLKELLAEGLKSIEASSPGTLEKLSHIKPRSRRIVARDPKHLFDKQHLVHEFGEKLEKGWWYGTNNSSEETSAWLQRACSCAGLDWGSEFKIG